MPDIDIDFANRDVILKKLKHRVAKLNDTKKHNTGIYVNEYQTALNTVLS